MKISPNISIIQKEAHAACHPITIITIQMRLIGLKLIHLSPMYFLHMVVTLDCQHTVRDCKILACFSPCPPLVYTPPGSTSIRYTSTSLESSYGKQVHTLYCPKSSFVGTRSSGDMSA